MGQSEPDLRAGVRRGVLWSPKRNANGARNPFYEYMREVAPGDLVLSFQGTRVRAVGIARCYAHECPEPAEFGSAGPNWNRIGWKVEVRFQSLRLIVSPVAHAGSLRRMAIPPAGSMRVKPFSEGQRANLDYHRDGVLLRARRG